MSDLPQRAAHPGYVDPFYEDKEWVQEWVDNPDRYFEHSKMRIVLPEFDPPSAIFDYWSNTPQVVTVRQITMERHKAYGPAPYVGEPFIYWWWVGVDNRGRQVASKEAQIQYVVHEPRWRITP